MNTLVSQIIVDILVNELSLSDQDVWVDNTNVDIDQGGDLKIAVGLVSSQVMSSVSQIETRAVPVVDSVFEVQTVRLQEQIQIDVMSKGVEALQRRWEVVAALTSIYAQQKQEENTFKIGKIPNSFVSTSAAEGSSQLARYTLSFSCLTWYSKEKSISANCKRYYDKFPTRVDDKDTIGTGTGIIEFTIDENTESP